MVEAGRSPNIKIITKATLVSVEGGPGRFAVRVHRLPRYVDEELCTGCDTCAKYCPVQVLDPYNQGLAFSKAVRKDYVQAVPSSYYIDPAHCLFLKHEMCTICVSACPSHAINLQDKDEFLDLSVGAIILSPGFGRIGHEVLSRFGYGKYPDVVTSMEFERLMSASGPSQGKILRPSGLADPRKIAFLQCIGSRDVTCNNNYCSSVCCMYSIKEAMIAKEHDPYVHVTIFYMDMRTRGKGFDQTRERSKAKYGIRYVRSRVASVEEADGSLRLTYVNDRGEHKVEEFDMVVLSEGLESPDSAKELSGITGIDLNKYDFCETHSVTPLETSRPGIFVAGAFKGPYDIPDCVTHASGATAGVAELLAATRGTEAIKKEYPPEIETGDEPRIGVFVCHCGTNIAGVVDVNDVAEYASTLDSVVFVGRNLYSCSQDTQELIKEKIKEQNVNRVVVAACTPRTHEALFQETLKEIGLNPSLFEMANIRDQCSWVHADTPEEATTKAKDLLRMAVAKARLIEPLKEQTVAVIPEALIIGGGLAGMSAALSLAEQGFESYLVEKTDLLGGNLNRMYYNLEGRDIRGFLKDIIKKVEDAPLVHVYKNSEVENISGYVGNFSTRLNTDSEDVALEHGVTIIATGGREYQTKRYLYGDSEQVVTQLEFEKILAGSPDPTTIEDIVMIQCVGSRGEDLEYCSRICCGQAVKNALKVRQLNPDANIYVLFRDMRTCGFVEDYYTEARDKGIIFIRYEVDDKPRVTDNAGSIRVEFTDMILGETVQIEPDYLVLSVAIVPNEIERLSKMLKTVTTQENFFLEAHVKLRPVESAVAGVFVCGLAHWPKSIGDSISQAKAAAAKAAILLGRGYVTVEPIVSSVDIETCIGCGICESLCPYASIRMIKVGKKKKAETISASCKGCGICASHCPTLSISMAGFTNKQILSQIGAFGEGS